MRKAALALCLALVPIAGAGKQLSGTDVQPQRAPDVATLKELACTAGHAYAARDLAKLDELTADDYVQTDVRGGVLKRAEWRDFVRNRKSELRVDCDSVEVRFYGDAAVVTGNWTYTKVGLGQD